MSSKVQELCRSETTDCIFRYSLNAYWLRDFPSGLVAKTLHFHCRGHVFAPWLGYFLAGGGGAKIMASSPITSWQIDGEIVEAVADFILGGSKITAAGDCSHEIKRRLLLARKGVTNLDSILKSRDITLSTKVQLVKALVFPVVMYGCKSWTIKKVECWRIDAFELWCWRRLLRVPWTEGDPSRPS